MSRKRDHRSELQKQLDAQQQRLQAIQDKYLLSSHGLSVYRDAVGPAKKPVEPSEPPPVFTECVVGYRVWSIDPFGRLRPQSVDKRPWLAGENVAQCDKRDTGGWLTLSWNTFGPVDPPAPEGHKAPAKGCDCGLYARFNPEDVTALTYDSDASKVCVAGSVIAWGDVQVHADGMRAEKAQITALATTTDMTPEVLELVGRVAERYGVPLVPMELLRHEALMHGAPVPEECRPAKRPSIEHQFYFQLSNQIMQPHYYGSSGSGYASGGNAA